MSRYKITVAYDGTGFAGWQVQPNGVTVQELIEKALHKLAGETVKVHGSGRTDAGVHARAQVAHFDLEKKFTPKALQRALNALLPDAIRIMRAERAGGDFHARKSAVGKEYRFFIWNGEILPPHLRGDHLHVTQPLDDEAMQKAADLLIGKHDFASFTANPNRVIESTVRELYSLKVRRKGREIVIAAEGEGFLYKMVRSLAGWLIRVGQGEVTPETTTEILDSQERTARVPTAPPQGLTLWRVRYPKR
jgi:tRNA pseudouridine38-40 synthase